MGKYNLSAQKVQAHATSLLQLGRTPAPPPWYNVMTNIPPSEVLTRRPMQRIPARTRKASRMFKPVQLEHKEDNLRWEFFNDHPWELARPRVVLENDGRDAEKWDWSHALSRPRSTLNNQQSLADAHSWEQKQQKQAGRPLNGESVIQRQQWLMKHTGLSRAAAYDKARKEFYAARHAQEIEQRVAKEEAMFYGAQYGMGALEVGMYLEDKAYENWRKWAAEQTSLAKTRSSSAYTGHEAEETAGEENLDKSEVVAEPLRESKRGQNALGGAVANF